MITQDKIDTLRHQLCQLIAIMEVLTQLASEIENELDEETTNRETRAYTSKINDTLT